MIFKNNNKIYCDIDMDSCVVNAFQVIKLQYVLAYDLI